MTDELSPDARALIRDAVAAEQPAGDGERRRLRRAVLAQAALVPGGFAAGSAAAATPSAASAGLKGAVQWTLLFAKGAGAGMLVIGALHGVAYLGRRTEPAVATPPNPAGPASAGRLTQASSLGAKGAAPVATHDASALPAVAPAPAFTPPHAADATGRPAGTLAAAPAPREDSSSLHSELELMAAAQRELRDGRPARALDVVARHAALYPAGQLVDERLAVEAIAACRSGDVARGRRAAAVLLKRDAGSALAARVQNACPAEDAAPR